jgi:hypothetical protein
MIIRGVQSNGLAGQGKGSVKHIGMMGRNVWGIMRDGYNEGSRSDKVNMKCEKFRQQSARQNERGLKTWKNPTCEPVTQQNVNGQGHHTTLRN